MEVEAIEHLLRYDWPGNVRELDGVLEEVRVRASGGAFPPWAVREVLGALPVRREVTQADAEAAMTAHDGNQSAAARALGITRGKLRRLMGLA